MWRVSAGVLEPLVGLRHFDHDHEVECTFVSRDGLVLRFEMVVVQDEVCSSRDQKSCARSQVSVSSVAHWAVSMDRWGEMEPVSRVVGVAGPLDDQLKVFARY